jgi:hypothetical protein
MGQVNFIWFKGYMGSMIMNYKSELILRIIPKVHFNWLNHI